MRLLIKEIESCDDCCADDDCVDMCFDINCPLPKIKNSNKKLLMKEIESCDMCCPYLKSIYKDDFRASLDLKLISVVCTHPDTQRKIPDGCNFPDWCPLPKVEPK